MNSEGEVTKTRLNVDIYQAVLEFSVKLKDYIPCNSRIVTLYVNSRVNLNTLKNDEENKPTYLFLNYSNNVKFHLTNNISNSE